MAYTQMGGSPTVNIFYYKLVGVSSEITSSLTKWLELLFVKDVIIVDDKCGPFLHKILKMQYKYSSSYSKYMTEMNISISKSIQWCLRLCFWCMKIWGGYVMVKSVCLARDSVWGSLEDWVLGSRKGTMTKDSGFSWKI